MKTTSVIIALLLIGSAVRLVVIDSRPEGAMLLAPDEPEYVELAHNLALGDGFSMRGEPTAYRDILFPAAASVVLRLSGGELRAVQYLQLVLSCLTGWLLFLLGRKRFSANISLGLCAAWMLYPGAILTTALWLTETLFIFLWVLALVFYDWLEEQPGVARAILLGVTLGLLTLTRQTGLLLVAAMAIYLILIRYETPFRQRLKTAAVILAACLLVILPWMTRNYVKVDSFSLNTNGGINLLIGNNFYTTGAYRFDEPVQELIPSSLESETERNNFAADYAREYFWVNTRKSINLWSKKFAYLWSTDMAMLTHYAPARGMDSLSTYLHTFSLYVLLLMALPYAVVVLTGVSGFYLVKKFPARGLFILQIFLAVVTILMAYGSPRYHLPLIPAMLIAGAAYVHAQPRKDAPQWRKLFLLLTLGLFGGIWIFEAATIAGF